MVLFLTYGDFVRAETTSTLELRIRVIWLTKLKEFAESIYEEIWLTFLVDS